MQNKFSAKVEKTLFQIWTDYQHPLHFANDRIIAANFHIFINKVSVIRKKLGILGVPARKKLHKKYIEDSSNQTTNILYADWVATEMRKIEVNRQKKRQARFRMRIADTIKKKTETSNNIKQQYFSNFQCNAVGPIDSRIAS